MTDKPIHTPVVVVHPTGELTVHGSPAAAEAQLRPLGEEAAEFGAYDALGDRLTVEVRHVAAEGASDRRRPTRRGLLFGALQPPGPTQIAVGLAKYAGAGEAAPWVRSALIDVLADAGGDEDELEQLSFGALAERALAEVGEP